MIVIEIEENEWQNIICASLSSQWPVLFVND